MNIRSIRQSRFTGFALVGGTVFALGLMLLSFLVEILKMDRYVAGAIVMFATLELNFVCNKYLNWADRSGKFLTQLWRFHVVRAGGLIFNQLVYMGLVAIGSNYIIVSISLSAIIMIYNYFGSDKVAFQ